MNYLIADSGATKTEWRLESDTESETFFTEGLSPYYHTTDTISDVIDTHLKPDLGDHSIDKIFFYGAGCDSPERDAIVEQALHHHFQDAKIEVNEDLLAAARACCGNEPGIACILGTGSNSCLYDGEKIVEHIPPLAFILGDEASAGYFGKKLINSYFRREIPDELKDDLEDNYNMSLSHIMLELYDDGAQQSRFIASYSKFLGKHSEHPFAKDILHEGFENFITRIVKKYEDAASRKVSFVGSVANAHQELIKEILREEGLKSGRFVQKPLERLVNYHTQ